MIKSIIGKYLDLLSNLIPRLSGKQAFYLFCIPFKAKLNEKQQAFLNSSKKERLKLGDQEIQTYSWGEGSKLLLLVHGWQSNTYRWKNYIDHFDKKEYTIVGFDAPGHGNSDGLICNVPLYEEALKKVVSHYGKPSCIISHSIGAFSSLYFLYKNNYVVDKLITMASPYSATQFVEHFRRELSVNEKTIVQLKRYFEKYTGHSTDYFSIEQFAPSIRSKTLIIHDEEDLTTSAEHAVELHGYINASEYYPTKGFGHKLKSASVMNKVSQFVAS